MRRKPGRFALAAISILSSLILAACSSSAPTLRYVSVAPTSATIFVAANTVGTTTTYVPCTTQQFTATGYYSDGSQSDISSTAGWSSSNTSAATIDGTGLASAVASAGPNGATSVITATAGGAAATANLAVNVLTSIAVTPANATIALGLSQAYTATGTFVTPGSTTTTTMDLTSQVTWSVPASQTVASIDSTGLLTTNGTGQGQGTTTVTAALCGVSGTTGVTVGPPVAASLQISPDSPTLAVGQTLDFTAVVVNTDGSTSPVTPPITWASDTTTVATITSEPAGDGLAMALASGTAMISASMGTSPNVFTGSTTLTVSAAVARFAYSANTLDSSISGYATQASTGTFTPFGKIAATQPLQAIAHTSGMFLYSINGNNTITVDNINPVSGGFVSSGLPPTASGTGSERGVIDPSGRWLYVVDGGSSMVFTYSIDQTTGALAAVGSGVVTGAGPVDVLVTPNDQFVYVINGTANSVSAYSIGTTGALTAITGPTTTLNSPQFSAIDPTGTYLFVPNSGNNTVVPFTIAADGSLTAGTAFTVTGASALAAVAVDPTSKFLYTVDSPSSGTGNLYALSIGSGGALSATINSGNPYPLGDNPTGVAVDPTGTIVAVANNFDNTLSVFTAATDGSLTPDKLVETGAGPQFPIFANGTAEAASSVAGVVAANSTVGTLSAFTVDSSGALTLVNSTPFTSVAGNSQIANLANGTAVYTGSASAKVLGGYVVHPASATSTFTQIAAPVTTVGAAGNVAAGTTGFYVYVTDTTDNTIAEHKATDLSLVGIPYPIAGGVLGLAEDLQGSLIYALGTNNITPLITSAVDGSLVVKTPLSATGTWSAGAVSPSGRFLAAVDSSTNKLQVFTITAIGSGAVSADGALTPLGTAVSIPGAMTVSSVAFDPLGRFLVVTDSAANTVTPFTISSSGALTAGTALTTPTGAGQATFDATGSWLFVAVYGTPASTPAVAGGVQVYSVAADGTLTAVSTPVSADNGTKGVGVLNQLQ
jgi:6-phosphogluconolactonase (cycloisomerase 2 family)